MPKLGSAQLGKFQLELITNSFIFFSKLGAEDEEEYEDAADEPNNEAKKRGPGVGKKVLFLNTGITL